MFDSPIPNHPDPATDRELSGADLALRLPADAYWQLIHTLRLTLPPPLDGSPDALLRRDHAAIARIAALAPVNAAEADVAAQFVAASEQWKDCLRLAQEPHTTPEWSAKCRAQAVAMMRQSQSALKLLLRMQEARRKVEKDSAAADRLLWSEHCAASLMAEALASPPPAPPIAAPIEEEARREPDEGEGEPCHAPINPEQEDRYRAMLLGGRGAGSQIVSIRDQESRHMKPETAMRIAAPPRSLGKAEGRIANPAAC